MKMARVSHAFTPKWSDKWIIKGCKWGRVEYKLGIETPRKGFFKSSCFMLQFITISQLEAVVTPGPLHIPAFEQWKIVIILKDQAPIASKLSLIFPKRKKTT